MGFENVYVLNFLLICLRSLKFLWINANYFYVAQSTFRWFYYYSLMFLFILYVILYEQLFGY